MAVLRVSAGSGCEYHVGTGHEYRAEKHSFQSGAVQRRWFWALDIVNNNFAPSYVEYFFWLEDDQGDAVEGDSGQVMLAAKSRESVQLTFGCEVPFTELRPHFRWAPVGFTRP